MQQALHPSGIISDAFLVRGCATFGDACRYIAGLPYQRVDTTDPVAVLTAGAGTCSTKHALLRRLAAEQGRPDVRLVLAIYMMDAENTPGVGEVLAASGMESVPEAHCFLRVGDTPMDFTWQNSQINRVLESVQEEIEISPDQIGDFKVNWHRGWMKNWVGLHHPGRDFEEVWAVREACIQALSRES